MLRPVPVRFACRERESLVCAPDFHPELVRLALKQQRRTVLAFRSGGVGSWAGFRMLRQEKSREGG